MADRPFQINRLNLSLDHIRPLNHPVRRLVYLVKLLGGGRLDGLWDSMLNHWLLQSVNLMTEKGCRLLQKSLMQLIPTYDDLYWNTHYIFEAEEKPTHLSLLGDNVRREILINAFLPMLYAILKKETIRLLWKNSGFFIKVLRLRGLARDVI